MAGEEQVIGDLAAEGDDLAALLTPLTDTDWERPTPAAGWTVRHQVAHLADGDDLAALALADPAAFEARLASLLADLGAIEAALGEAAGPPGDLLDRWEASRRAVVDGLRAVAPGARIGWVTGPMSVRSFATARLMETWAHGQDVRDAIGAPVAATDRLRHIAHLGVATRRFSFTNRGLPVPEPEPRVGLVGPSGDTWTWGPDDSTESITGPALDFCLLVTQRRHRSRTALVADGAGADAWLDIAQCFAGPPTAPSPAL